MKYKNILATSLGIIMAVFISNQARAQGCEIYMDKLQAQSNSTVTFCINIDQAPNMVDAFGFDVVYDGAILTYAGNWAEGDLTSGFQFFDVNEPSPGRIRIGGFTTENAIQEQAGGTVACLEFAIGDCAPATLALTDMVDDISGWAQCDGELSCWGIELTQISLQSPADRTVVPFAPTFDWTADGGANNAYSVDITLSPGSMQYWSTYENLHLAIRETSWTMPEPVWGLIPAGAQVYWRVRGVDLGHEPRTIVRSDEIFSFFK